MFKTIFVVKKKKRFNVTFASKKLFEQHQKWDHFEDVKVVLYFGSYSERLFAVEDIVLYRTQDHHDFPNYSAKETDVEIAFSPLSVHGIIE